eukprot:GSChrysophyteH1.ASY1.ANO1.2999.1 assembled CDS
MGPKKGKSLEEKRQILLSIYHSEKAPFNLKEIEREGSKKGVVQQVIKDVNQSLLDDSLIQSDKIGSGNFFWSFPSKTAQDSIVEMAKIDASIKKATENINILNELKRKAELSRCDTQRSEKLQKLERLQQEEREVTALLEISKDNDPAEIERINKLATNNQESANRWVDNTYAVKSYLSKKRGLPSREVDKYLGINDDFDYYDDSMIFKASKKGSVKR